MSSAGRTQPNCSTGAVVALSLVASLACTAQREPDSARTDTLAKSASPPALGDMRWAAVSLREKAVLQGSRITMEVAPTSIGGYGGCNWYGGDVAFTEFRLDAEPMTRTMRACGRPEGVTEQENEYMALIEQSTRFERAADTLRFFDRQGQVLITFLGTPRLAMRPEDLANTRWILSTWTRGPRPLPRMTLAFEGDRTRGFAGCRNFTGSWNAKGDEIHFPTLSMVEMDCTNRKTLEIEGNYTTALSESAQYRLEKGKRLELFTPGGDTLVFTPEP